MRVPRFSPSGPAQEGYAIQAEQHGIVPAASASSNVSRLNALMQTAYDRGVGVIDFGSGQFNFNGQINFQPRITLRGLGSGHSFASGGVNAGTIFNYTGNGLFLNVSGAGGSSTAQIEKNRIYGMSIVGPGKTVAGTIGMKLWNIRNPLFYDVYFSGWETGSLMGRDSNNDICYGIVCNEVWWNQCKTGVLGAEDGGGNSLLVFADFFGCTLRSCGLAGAGGGWVGGFVSKWVGGFCGGNACSVFNLKGAQNCLISTDIENTGIAGGGYYDILATQDSAGNPSQGIAIVGTGTAVSGASFGRTASMRMDYSKGYFIAGHQVAAAASDSATFIGVEATSNATGFVAPGHYEGFTGTQVKETISSANNMAWNENAQALTRFYRLSDLSTDEVIRALINGEVNSRYTLDSTGKQQWGSGAATRDCFLEREAANLMKMTASLHLYGASGAYLTLAPIDAANAANESVFIDSADGVLKFKDSGGVSHALY